MDTYNTGSNVEASGGSVYYDNTFTICLLSRDTSLLELCHEAVRGLEFKRTDVILLDPDHAQDVAADLLVWDTDSIPWSSRTLDFAGHREQLFLVSRKGLHEFLTRMPLGAGSTLLKPLSLRTLQIFVEQVSARKRDRARASAQIDLQSEESRAKDVLQCLLMANLKLQEYDQDRTNFLARAVHDFRTPLMSASGYCSILLEEAMGPLNSSQADLVQRVQHSIDKLTRMAAGMLQLSVGKHVVRAPDLREAPIEACITTAVREIERLIHDKHITVSVRLSDPPAPLYLEPQLIEQVVLNLLENSSKFTPKGGTIEVRGYPTNMPEYGVRAGGQDSSPESPNAYRVDVSDSGSGILPEHLQSVFEEYTSYGGSQDRSGGGLGLAICKMILTAHKGQIWAENISGGARLSLVLPLGKVPSRKWIEGLAVRAAAGAAS